MVLPKIPRDTTKTPGENQKKNRRQVEGYLVEDYSRKYVNRKRDT